MSSAIQKHLWADIVNAPALPGVYAWYYSPEITDYDLEQTITQLKAFRDTDRAAAETLVRTTMDNRVFKHFREDPYQARLEGPLKPTYTGTLEHTFEIPAGWCSASWTILTACGRSGMCWTCLRLCSLVRFTWGWRANSERALRRTRR